MLKLNLKCPKLINKGPKFFCEKFLISNFLVDFVWQIFWIERFLLDCSPEDSLPKNRKIRTLEFSAKLCDSRREVTRKARALLNEPDGKSVSWTRCVAIFANCFNRAFHWGVSRKILGSLMPLIYERARCWTLRTRKAAASGLRQLQVKHCTMSGGIQKLG